MKYLVLVLVGCVSSSDPNLIEDPSAPEASLSLTAHDDFGDVATNLIPTCPTGTWCSETSPVPGIILHAVSAVSASDVFVVGDAGTILRRTGSAWTTMTSGTTANLRGVWVLSSSDVWACGAGGVILHYNGTAWSSVSSGYSTDCDATWAAGANDVWFTGSSVALHYNGSGFIRYSFAGTMLAVSGTGSNDVWITGENTNAHHWDGTSWTTFTPGAGTSTYLTVLAVSASDVWVADFNSPKQTMHYTGTSTWTAKATTPSATIFNSMSDVAANDIWGVGASGKIAHWNGTAWSTSVAPFGSVSLFSVTTPPGHVFTVGDGSTIGHMPL